MARPVRPPSDSYPSVCCTVNQSVSYTSEAGTEDEDDQSPIFSISKSSMDVLMATGPPHKRDPAWTRMDLRRSSSTNTHNEQNPVMLQQLHPHMWQHMNSNQLLPTTQSVNMHSPPAIGERWISNMQRWSGCSGGAQSRSSTPETVVWKGGSSRPCSLTQEPPCSAAPDFPFCKLTSPPDTPSPFISPLYTPTLPPVDLLTPSSSTATLRAGQDQQDFLESTPTHSPLPSPLPSPLHSPLPSPLHSPLPSPLHSPLPSPLPTPLPTPTPSPLQTLTPSPLQTNSPALLQLTSTEDEGFLENNLLTFQFPSPIPSSVSLAEAGALPDPGSLVDEVIEKLSSPRPMQLLEDEGVRSPVQMCSSPKPSSPAAAPEPKRDPSVLHLELPQQSEQICPAGRGRRSPLVSSLSDSRLGSCCKCNTREGTPKATMTSMEMVDAAVQTTSPVSSWWNLRRNTSTSNMGSHSILGSPPGSRLNLRSSVGSHSNLVSPSSSMFPVSSGEEEEEERRGDDPEWDIDSPSAHDPERRRSCLKIQAEEKDDMGRRSSMKQVQWDEDGMTWDIHGASVEPEVLSSAIRKHLELQNTPRPLRRSSKKKKAPKPPVIPSKVPEISPPVMIITSMCIVEGESEVAPETDEGREVEKEGVSKKEEAVEAPRRRSRAEAENTKEEEEEEEVYGEEGSSHPKSPSSGHSRKKSVIRSLRRPGWCGGSRKADN